MTTSRIMKLWLDFAGQIMLNNIKLIGLCVRKTIVLQSLLLKAKTDEERASVTKLVTTDYLAEVLLNAPNANSALDALDTLHREIIEPEEDKFGDLLASLSVEDMPKA